MAKRGGRGKRRLESRSNVVALKAARPPARNAEERLADLETALHGVSQTTDLAPHFVEWRRISGMPERIEVHRLEVAFWEFCEVFDLLADPDTEADDFAALWRGVSIRLGQDYEKPVRASESAVARVLRSNPDDNRVQWVYFDRAKGGVRAARAA